MIRQTEAGVVVDVRVVPRAKRTTIDGIRDDAIVIRVAAPPADNAANEALIAFLSRALNVPRRAVTIVAGVTSRQKRIAIEGVTVAAVQTWIDRPAPRTRRSPT